MDRRYASVTDLQRDLEKMAHGGKRRWWAALGAIILLAVGVVFLLNGGEQPVTQPDAQTAVEDWTTDVKPDALRFQYDLDGDGTAEDYLFGVGFLMEENGQTEIWKIRQDEFALGAMDGQWRRVVPCVWRETDGGPEPVSGFAALLDGTDLKLWRVPPTGGDAPAVERLEYGGWQGGAQMRFESEQTGTWLYEARAELDGQSLVATAISIIRQE